MYVCGVYARSLCVHTCTCTSMVVHVLMGSMLLYCWGGFFLVSLTLMDYGEEYTVNLPNAYARCVCVCVYVRM